MSTKPTPGDFGTAYQSRAVLGSVTAGPTVRASAAAPKPAAPVTTPRSAAPVASRSAWLELPTLGVRAAIRNVVTVNGVLGVPDNPAEVGWWTGSAPAGSSTGSTVIDGHVDSARTGPGALFHLVNLMAGEPISLTTTEGLVVRYRVTGRHVYLKHQGLPPDLFVTTGPPRLVLITCGGPFNSTARSYEDNIVVFATPVA